ncbi:MAG TPA: nuclear transport factor 2 family protein [Terrimicrobiaceae bacterium]|nr:nuclear transport factor 2 family protein [Terrimicrobiaceae bacterium]
MTEQQNIETIRELYAAFGRADVSFILTKLTDDVKWVSHFDGIVPWSGDFSGKDRVKAFFEAIFQSVDVEGFDPQEWVAKASTVVSIGEFACRVRATGKTARTRWVFLWKFRDDKVCSYEQFHDPALAEAFR